MGKDSGKGSGKGTAATGKGFPDKSGILPKLPKTDFINPRLNGERIAALIPVGNGVGHGVKMFPRLVGERNFDHSGLEPKMGWGTPALTGKGSIALQKSLANMLRLSGNAPGLDGERKML